MRQVPRIPSQEVCVERLTHTLLSRVLFSMEKRALSSPPHLERYNASMDRGMATRIV